MKYKKIFDQIAYRCCIKSILNRTSDLSEITIKFTKYSALSDEFKLWLKDWLNNYDCSVHGYEDLHEQQLRVYIACQSDTLIFDFIKDYKLIGYTSIKDANFNSITLPASTPASLSIENNQRERVKFQVNLRRAEFLGEPHEWFRWDVTSPHPCYLDFGQTPTTTELDNENTNIDVLFDNMHLMCKKNEDKEKAEQVIDILRDIKTRDVSLEAGLKEMNLGGLLNALGGKGIQSKGANVIDKFTQNVDIKTQEPSNTSKAMKRRQKKVRAQARKAESTTHADDEVHIEPHIEIKMNGKVNPIKKVACLTKTLSSLYRNGVSLNYKDFDRPISERLHIAEKLINGKLGTDGYISNHKFDSQGDAVEDVYVYLKVFEKSENGKYPKVDGFIEITDFSDLHEKGCCRHTEGSRCLMRVANQPGLLMVMKAANKQVLAKWRALEDAAEADEYPSSSEDLDYSLSQYIPFLPPITDKAPEENCSRYGDIVKSYVEHNAHIKAMKENEEDRSLRHKPSIDIYAEGIWFAYTKHAWNYSVYQYEKFAEETSIPEPSTDECRFAPKTRSQSKRLIKQFVEQNGF